MNALRRFLCAACALLAVAAASAAAPGPLQRELGHGLTYFRLRELPADLPPAPAGRPQPCVVDLRYVRADQDDAAAFLAWLRFRAGPRSPVFVLANSQTSPLLRKPLTAQPRNGGVVVVGIPAGDFTPHIAVNGTAENERRAYDALDQGAALMTLLTDNPNKVRNDEASLSRDRLADASADAAGDASASAAPPPPVDVTLQRAVHLHRALVALRKL